MQARPALALVGIAWGVLNREYAGKQLLSLGSTDREYTV